MCRKDVFYSNRVAVKKVFNIPKDTSFFYQSMRWNVLCTTKIPSEIIYDGLNFSQKDRWPINKIKKHIKETAEYFLLDVSQTSALEENKLLFAQENCYSSELKSHVSDVTNGCAFLSVGIIDRFQKLSLFDPSKAIEEMTDIITEFWRKFNPFQDISKYFNIYEAYTILNGNNLLKNNFIFSEKLVDNSQLYSYGIQTKTRKELGKLQST